MPDMIAAAVCLNRAPASYKSTVENLHGLPDVCWVMIQEHLIAKSVRLGYEDAHRGDHKVGYENAHRAFQAASRVAAADEEEVFEAYHAVEIPTHGKTGECTPKPDGHWGARADSAEEKRGDSSVPVPRAI